MKMNPLGESWRKLGERWISQPTGVREIGHPDPQGEGRG